MAHYCEYLAVINNVMRFESNVLMLYLYNVYRPYWLHWLKGFCIGTSCRTVFYSVELA